jgi:hypothetical protein
MWALALLAGGLLAGCGGDDSNDSTTASSEDAPTSIEEIQVDTGPFDSDEEFLDAATKACSDYGVIYDRAPVYGVGAEGLTAEFNRRVEINEAFQDDLESIEPTDALADEYQAFVDASAEINANEDKVLKAAKSGDVDTANEILNGPSSDAVAAYGDAADELGACNGDDPPSQDRVSAASDEAGDAPQPSNSAEDAADEYLAALQSGDCKQLADAQHTQLYADELEDCSQVATDWKDSEVLASAQYGPAGAAELGSSESAGYTSFMLDKDRGDALKYTGTIYASTNGLEEPNEGIDADETIDTALQAIRDDNVDLFDQTLPLDTVEGDGSFFQTGKTITELGNDPTYAKRIVEDIKSDTDAEPQPLGVNQVDAYYLLDTEKTDYILVARHEPGSETHYAFTAYWALSD